jgi:serine/threonine protein kinase
LDDPTKQELADQLLQQMEAPSSNLKMLFLNLEGFVRNGKVLGSGSFGAVQSTTYLGSPCAVKVVGVSSPGLKGLFQKELDVIKELGHHPHLVRLFCYSHSEEDQSSYLIMEKMDMDLSKAVLLNKGAKLPMIKAVSLMLQIADGVEFIHSKRVAHRDLKPENVLVNRETSSGRSLPRIRSVKIADFGVSKTKEASKTYSNQTANTGTSWYMAPEVIKIGEDDSDNPRFNPRKADVYSFAIMCAVILNGKGPYDDSGESAKQIKIKVKEGTLRPSLPAHCPARLGILIQKCWAGTPSKRPLFDVICRELRYIKGLLLRGEFTWVLHQSFHVI